jgi:hypothetical protein
MPRTRIQVATCTTLNIGTTSTGEFDMHSLQQDLN